MQIKSVYGDVHKEKTPSQLIPKSDKPRGKVPPCYLTKPLLIFFVCSTRSLTSNNGIESKIQNKAEHFILLSRIRRKTPNKNNIFVRIYLRNLKNLLVILLLICGQSIFYIRIAFFAHEFIRLSQGRKIEKKWLTAKSKSKKNCA
jgi:hypothetical protein